MSRWLLCEVLGWHRLGWVECLGTEVMGCTRCQRISRLEPHGGCYRVRFYPPPEKEEE